jgi:hypothetical protein
MAELRDFLSRVVAWPGDEPGYVNLHYTMIDPKHVGKKPFWSGAPTRTLKDFMSHAAWALKQKFIKDIYFCTSLQSKVKVNKQGKPKVVRLQANVLAMRSIFLDVDVKPPPKGYNTLTEALDAISQFTDAANLPAPTALVGSGGGVHVYWISDRPLSLEEWKPYAEGLKTAALKFGIRCDAGCTIDSARVLRVPGTINRKIDPPRPVRLLGLQEKDYDFKTDLAHLANLTTISGDKRPVLPADTLSGFSGQPAGAFAGLSSESLAEGITQKDKPRDWTQLVDECAFFRTALETGGKEYDQPQWNLSTLLATFLENGHGLAHAMGNKHPEYTRESTEALWDRKNRERVDRGLGWPSCSAIHAAGCKACETCPHFEEKKSPLHYTSSSAPTALVPGNEDGDTPVIPSDLYMPEGFGLDKEGHICRVKLFESDDEEDGPPVPVYMKLFTCRLSKPMAQVGPFALNFTTTLDKGHTGRVSIEQEIIQGNATALFTILGRQGVKIFPPNTRYIQEFFMAWYTKLHEAHEATRSVPFGWLIENGKRRGFVYGGFIFRDDGSESAAGMGDAELRDEYQPIGDRQMWIDACKLVTDQKRPELDVIIAAAFAAPLMIVTGEYSALLSAWGAGGVGKSTSIKVGQAVWGHSKKSKEVTSTTSRSVVHKMGQLRNLPIYWDEVKSQKAQKQVFETVFSGSEGIGPGRLTANIEQRARTDWQTLLIIASNLSFVDHIVSEQKTTSAGIYRVFEYHIPSVLPNAPGQIDAMDASRITQELESNYGLIGLEYARMLGTNPYDVDYFTRAECRLFSERVKAKKEERFWVALCGTLIAGSMYANSFGAQIDIEALTKFLAHTYELNRERLTDEATEGGTRINTEEALTGFLKASVENTLYTNTVPSGAGRPKQVDPIVGPDPRYPKPIYVQWVVDDKQLRISRPRFAKFMREQNISSSQIINGLRDFFGAKHAYTGLGAGTVYHSGQEHVLIIPVKPNTPLGAQLLIHTPVAQE